MAELPEGWKPAAYVVYAPNGNVRLWSTEQREANKCAEANGLTVTTLYAPTDGVAAGSNPQSLRSREAGQLAWDALADGAPERLRVHEVLWDNAPSTYEVRKPGRGTADDWEPGECVGVFETRAEAEAYAAGVKTSLTADEAERAYQARKQQDNAPRPRVYDDADGVKTDGGTS